MSNIRITDKQTVTPTGSDFMLINQAGSDKNTTLARLKTYMNGSTTLETVAQDTNSAINEVNTKATDASTGINGIKNTIGSGNLETTSQNIIGAVNEVNTKVGNEKLETVAENATGAINELNQKIGNVDIENDGDIAAQLNAKVNKTSIINNCLTTEEGFVGDARQLKYLKDYIDSLMEGTLKNPYYHANDTSGLGIINNGWNHCQTSVEAPEETGDYLILVLNPYRSSQNVNGTLLKQIWFHLWNNNIYVRHCNITDGWVWSAFKQI